MKSVERSSLHPIIMLNPGNGPIKNPEGKFVFVGRVYGTPSVNEDKAKVNELLMLFPRLDATELLHAKDGIYTWLLYSVGNSDEVKFISTEVVSPFEIGTRHQSMAHNSRVNATKIYGGGELIKKDTRIEFNLLSGTYSKSIVQYNYDKSITKGIVSGFKSFFPDATYDDSMDSYIDKVKTVSDELLEIYKKYGYTVRVFDKHNDWVKFSNNFWNIDWGLEYYKKKVDEVPEAEKNLMRTMYKNSLENMIKLLEGEDSATGGTRRRKRSSGKNQRQQARSRGYIRSNKSKKGGSKLYTSNGNLKALNEKTPDGFNFFRKMGYSSNEHAIGALIQKTPHPNIVKVYSVTDKYMDIEEVKPISSDWDYDEAAFLSAMKKAKDHLQSLGIMYIDWKPDNAGLGSDGQYKLYDFDASGVATSNFKKWVVSPPDYYWSYSQALANGLKAPKEIDDFAFHIGLIQKNYKPLNTA